MVSCNPLMGINSSDFGIKKGTVDRVLSDSEIKLFWNACYHSRIVPKNKIKHEWLYSLFVRLGG